MKAWLHTDIPLSEISRMRHCSENTTEFTIVWYKWSIKFNAREYTPAISVVRRLQVVIGLHEVLPDSRGKNIESHFICWEKQPSCINWWHGGRLSLLTSHGRPPWQVHPWTCFSRRQLSATGRYRHASCFLLYSGRADTWGSHISMSLMHFYPQSSWQSPSPLHWKCL